MKGKRKLSFLVAMIIAITNVAFVAMSSASAEGSDFIVSDDFEGYTNVVSTNAVSTLESMQEICDMNPWWYSVRSNATSTVFNKADDVGENTPLIASVVSSDGNKALRLTYHAEAGIGTNITIPEKANQYVYESGSYEISFKFYATGDMTIYGIGGKMVDGNAVFYRHNIVTKSSGGAYVGDTEATTPAGVGGAGISSNTWYTLKVVVNNDLGYYSVDICDKSGKSLQRVGGINFKDGCDGIANIRFQVPTEGSVVYIDDYAVKRVNRDKLLYEDDFNIYSGFSSTPQNYTLGANLFKEISQFRVQDKNSQFVLGSHESDASNKYFQLKASKAGSQYYPANAMYMPWNGYILTKDSQSERGKLQLNFSFSVDNAASPSGTTASFRVICADKFSATDIPDLENDKYTMFRVQPFAASGGKVAYGIQNKSVNMDSSSAYQQINKSQWYDVELVFDPANDKVVQKVTQSGTSSSFTYERTTGLYNDGTPLEAIKSIMFKADEGMVIDIDNFELKYVVDAPYVNEADVKITDFDGDKVFAGATDVNPAIATIEIPFTTPVSDDSVTNITLKAEGSDEAFAGYKATNENGVYKMSFNKPLLPNTKYTLNVPTTVTDVDGKAIFTAYNCVFTTGAGSDTAEMGIKALSIKSVADITNGGKIQVRTKYANTTDTADTCLMIVAYYDVNDSLIGSSFVDGTLAANTVNMDFLAGVTVPGEDKLDLSKVKSVSVYLWDSYSNIRPYCEAVTIE